MEKDIFCHIKVDNLKKFIKKILGLEAYERILPLVISKISLGKLKTDPDFIIIGQQKCGTTSLLNYINQHDKIVEPITKQSHYFDRSSNRDISFYRAHFIKKFFSSSKKIGEATPDYFDHPEVLDRIKSKYPKIKLILILRSPLDRAFSHYQMSRKLGFEKLSFEEALVQEDNRISNDPKFGIEKFGYFYKSDYLTHLTRWELAYKDLLFVMKLEDLEKGDLNFVERLWSFLGLNPPINFQPLKKLNSGQYSVKPMLNSYWHSRFEQLEIVYHDILV